MDAIQVAHRCVDEGLEGRGGDTLEDARRDEARIAVLGMGGASPRTSNDQQQGSAHEEMSLAPDAAGRHKDKGREAHAEQIPSRQLSDLRKLFGEVE